MDNSGFSQPPTPSSGPRAFPPGRGDQAVKIEKASGTLKLIEHPTRIEGEVVRHNRDGTIRIRTAKGELDIRVRGRDIPAEGKRIEIDLPAGRPPRQAVIRPAPPQADMPPPQTRPEEKLPPPSMPPDRETAPAERLSPRLSEEAIRSLASQNAPALETRQIPLRPDDVVRLLALPPGQTLDIIGIIEKITHTVRATLTRITPAARPLPLPAALKPAAPIVTPTPPEPPEPPAAFRAFPETATIRFEPVTPVETQIIMAKPATGQPQLPTGWPVPVEWPKPMPERMSLFLDIRVANILPPVAILTAPDDVTVIGSNSFVKPDTVPPAAPLPEGQAGALRGRVIGIAPNQLPIVQIGFAPDAWPELFVLQFPASNLPPGATIEFIPLPGTPAPTQIPLTLPATPAGQSPLPPFFIGFDWPAMENIVRTVQQAAPQVMPNLVQSLPSPAAPARLPLAALIFIAAVQAGDLTNWLGQKTVDTLRRAGRGEAIDRLGRDFAGLQKASSEPVSQDWRAMTLPLYWQDQIHKAHLYYRRDKNDNESGDENRQTRFIFDLDLTRMGAVQLDGLHRGRKLDLILRTRTPLSPVMQKTMRRNYIRALEQVDVTGELSFQGRPEQFIKFDLVRATGGVTA